MQRYVLYGGKGGVGKTTCAAATGLALADRGERTLLVSTDPAHSLGDALEAELGGDPSRIEANLWGVEADPERGQEAYRRVFESLAAEFRAAGVGLSEEDVERLFAAGAVPGSDEVAALAFLDDDWREFDRIVLDTAPTGHTLRLLDLPDILDESLATATKVRGEVRRLVASARSVVFGPAAFFGRRDDDEIEAFRERMARVGNRLRDPRQTEFRVVLLPERLALTETRRLVESLRAAEIPVETLLVNRVLEMATPGCERCLARKQSHERMLDEIRRTFPGMDVQVLADLGPEAYGREALDALAGRIEI